MTCRKQLRWFIESLDGTSVLVQGKNNLYFWSPKVFGQTPKLYRSVRKCRKAADAREGIVRNYRQSAYYLEVGQPF